ncbi:MAG: DUF262 domain-containing protein [Nannocystaceae bacterium]|nr:DUF262 domain-containing protein [Nannocystaceae bacterium]
MSSVRTQNAYAALSRPPEATTVTVKGLIAKVKNGGVRVPSFQRPLRWKRADVRTLFDSVWRGYPIGSLLFWKREGPAEEITVGSARLNAPLVVDAWWVVDGQQRTTALAATLLDLDHGDDKRWELYFNPREQAFTEDPSGVATIPLSVLGDLRLLGRWLRERDLEDSDIDKLEDAQQRILDYSIPAYVVETDDVGALRAVFSRMNSSGVRMRAEEVFHALVGDKEDKDAIDLESLQRVCDENGFGQPSRGEVLKCVLAMSGLDPT